MTNLEKLKQEIANMSSKEFAAMAWNANESCHLAAFEEVYCHSVDSCDNIECKECFANWLDQEVKE